MRCDVRSCGRALPAWVPIIAIIAAACGGGGGGGRSAPDIRPPSFAGATGASTLTDTRILVEWNAATDDRDPAGSIVYNVYLATAPGGQDFSIPDAITAPGAERIDIGGLVPGTTYFFVVRAVDTSGNEDDNTVEVSATTLTMPDTQPPVFGGATGAVAISSSAIDLFWTAAADDNTPASFIRYNVYVATSSGAQNFASPDASSAPGATSITVSGLLPSTTYFFVVRAVDAAGNEDANTIEVSDTTFTPDTTPPTFAGLQSAVSGNPTRVDLSWNAASDNQSAPADIIYRIYFSTTSGGQNFAAPDAETAAGALAFTVMGLNPATDYFFVVRAVDLAGNEDSNTVEVAERTLVSFSGNVLGIFTSNCAFSNCHGSTSPQHGLQLTNYSSIFNTAINITAVEPSPAMDRIEPSDSTLSYLQHKIDGTHLSVGGSGLQMPWGMPPLPLTDRDLIRDWIDQGAQDN